MVSGIKEKVPSEGKSKAAHSHFPPLVYLEEPSTLLLLSVFQLLRNSPRVLENLLDLRCVSKHIPIFLI